MSSKFARRVDQLDAIALDDELYTLLNVQYRKVLACIPSQAIAKYGQELDVLFRFFFRYLPLAYLGGSFGQHVFSLKYFDGKFNPASLVHLRLLAVISICSPWVWERILKKIISQFVTDKQSSRFEVVESLESRFQTLWKLFSLINLCIFLRKAHYPTVYERILGIKPLYTSQPEIQLPHYDGIARELLWHGLSEFLGFALPFINVFRVKNCLMNLWFSLNSNNRFKYMFVTSHCLICGKVPNFPHTLGCRHTFCYYCLSSMVLADPYYKCLYCNIPACGLECIKPVPINKPDGQVTEKK